MRLFVGAYPPVEALEHLAGAVDGLAVGRAAGEGVNARLVPPARWHLTVAFLGEIDPDRVPDVSGTVTGAVRRWRAEGGRPPELSLGGGGRFGRGRSTVLWVGLRGDTGAMTGLGGTVARALRRSKFDLDRVEFRPHLTIARPGDRLPRPALEADIALLDGYAGPAWTLRSLALVSSELGPSPVHTVIETFPLDGS